MEPGSKKNLRSDDCFCSRGCGRKMVDDRRRRHGSVAAEPSLQKDLSAKRRRLSLRHKPPVGFSPFLRSVSNRLLGSTAGSRSPSEIATKSGSNVTRMPSSTWSPAVSSSDEEDSDTMDDDDDEEEEEEMAEETVQVDFGFFDPKPEDFHGVKLLLRSYLGDREWDLSGFVDLILGQTTVGTVVKSDSDKEEQEEETERETGEADEDGPYAVITALNLGRYETHQCIKQLKNYILEACSDDLTKKKLKIMLGGKEVHKLGLLVCERFVNFPPQPVLPLYEGLFDEVSWAIEDEPTQEFCDSFRFKSYLILTRIFMRKEANFKGRPDTSSGKKSKGSGSQDDESMVFVKLEDEILLKLCSSSAIFDFPRKEQVVPPELKGYKEMGLLMVLESSKVPAFREELKLLLQEDA